jgi:hypothetical protein
MGAYESFQVCYQSDANPLKAFPTAWFLNNIIWNCTKIPILSQANTNPPE